ncbi:transcription factor GTE6-like isoform X2 [Cannabis sativa]|uniref:transcription factor GTE6-like isoform X2 n=1 Tax=Cannabis sativa TaxID=3483 RepID=UPI0029CA1569|nr:transcription factor GTE6-like isoform X2 [Cannabis sativa]XP_060966192.1 transcription factor GTE6-like isoform X2 [Cannabis sativa]
MDVPVLDVLNVPTVSGYNNVEEVEGYQHLVDELSLKIEELEQKMIEVEQFNSSTSKKHLKASKGSSNSKDKDKEKHIPSLNKQQQEASKREAAAAKRMHDLMRQFGTILSQITRHKWAWPFMQPVDVEGLGLHDYYEVIDKPMDFNTIKNQMEANDGTGYKNVRQICGDVRLVFKNAMKYNEERSNVHVMAKTLLKKFEEKWLQFLPKVIEEEKRREEEEAEAQMNIQLVYEAAHNKMARDINNELHELDLHLEELREMVVQKCRKISVEEKRKLGASLTKLSPEDLSKALEIVAQNNPGFQATAEEVDLDINAQIESTLWRLKFFVKDALEIQGKSSCSASLGGNNNSIGNANNNNNDNDINISGKERFLMLLPKLSRETCTEQCEIFHILGM